MLHGVNEVENPTMTDPSGPHCGVVTLDSLGVPTRSLSELVKDALANDDTLNRTALARRAKMTPKTLRDILDGTQRRYGESTLRGLDDALGWQRGTAQRVWDLENGGDPVAAVADQLDRVDQQYAELLERLARVEEQPSWVDEVVSVGRLLNPGDRRAWLDLGHRLARS